MKLFDSLSEEQDEEVIIRNEDVEEDSRQETRLGQEVNEKVAGSDSDPSRESSPDTGVDLPGMSSGSSTSRSSSSSIDIEDVHDQNREIISLLEDIRDEVGGGSSELL